MIVKKNDKKHLNFPSVQQKPLAQSQTMTARKHHMLPDCRPYPLFSLQQIQPSFVHPCLIVVFQPPTPANKISQIQVMPIRRPCRLPLMNLLHSLLPPSDVILIHPSFSCLLISTVSLGRISLLN